MTPAEAIAALLCLALYRAASLVWWEEKRAGAVDVEWEERAC